MKTRIWSLFSLVLSLMLTMLVVGSASAGWLNINSAAADKKKDDKEKAKPAEVRQQDSRPNVQTLPSQTPQEGLAKLLTRDTAPRQDARPNPQPQPSQGTLPHRDTTPRQDVRPNPQPQPAQGGWQHIDTVSDRNAPPADRVIGTPSAPKSEHPAWTGQQKPAVRDDHPGLDKEIATSRNDRPGSNREITTPRDDRAGINRGTTANDRPGFDRGTTTPRTPVVRQRPNNDRVRHDASFRPWRHEEHSFSYSNWSFSLSIGDSRRSLYFHYGYFPYVRSSRVIIVNRPVVTYVEVPIVINLLSDHYYLDRPRTDGLDAVLSDIRVAWTEQSPELLLSHVWAGSNIDVLLDGSYSYTIGADDYRDMTGDAVTSMATISFRFDSVRRRADGRVHAFATHEYYDKNGDEQTVYVSYLLERRGGQWIIVEVGSSLSRLDQ
jgi:hypothetical protein